MELLHLKKRSTSTVLRNGQKGRTSRPARDRQEPESFGESHGFAKLIGDVRDFSEWENRPGTSSTAASGVQERPETCGETAPTKDADRASDIGVFDSDISGRCSSAPTSPFFGESFDGYGKIEYRAAPGQEGNWYQQDAYACGLILRDLQGSADILETVANGLLAPPEERLSVSDAAAILTGEL